MCLKSEIIIEEHEGYDVQTSDLVLEYWMLIMPINIRLIYTFILCYEKLDNFHKTVVYHRQSSHTNLRQ